MPHAPASLPAAASLRERVPWAWVRALAGAAILAVLLWRLGTGPFLDGLRGIDARTLLVAAGIGAVTTAGCAWRWCLVARGLGVRLPPGAAVAAYYRSQFLNATLPTGVLGDVHRALRHGRDVGDVGRAARAVVLERFAGQVVQVVIALTVLTVLPSPVRSRMPEAAAVLAVAGLGAVLLAMIRPRGARSRIARAVRTTAAELRASLFSRRNGPGIALASTVTVSGHLATFLLAARAAGATAPLTRLVPLGLLVLLAMAVPVNFGGWGPREGAAAWAFGAAGLSATLGVSTAVVYGVLVLSATAPGAGVLVARWIARVRVRRNGPAQALPRAPARLRRQNALHG